MDYQEGTDFVETLKGSGYDHNQKLSLVKALLWRGGKYEAMFNDIGKHKYTSIEMEKASIKADYFPEPETKKDELVKLVREILNIIRESDLSFIKFKDKEENV